MFITDEQLTASLASMLKKPAAQIAPFWEEIVTASNESAFGSIRSHFLARGFTAAQIDAWDQGPEYQRDIGLFWCLVKGGGLHGYDSTFIKMLDRRAELKQFDLETGGIPQEQLGSPKLIAYGKIEDDEDNDIVNLSTKF